MRCLGTVRVVERLDVIATAWWEDCTFGATQRANRVRRAAQGLLHDGICSELSAARLDGDGVAVDDCNVCRSILHAENIVSYRARREAGTRCCKRLVRPRPPSGVRSASTLTGKSAVCETSGPDRGRILYTCQMHTERARTGS